MQDELKWSFKIEFQNPSLWAKMEEIFGSAIPDDLKTFITECNAASPNKSHLMINDDERVFDSVLSFNESEKEALTFKIANSAIGSNTLVPFAIDPFGNFFCYSLETKKIAFYHNDEGRFEETDYSIKTFLEALY